MLAARFRRRARRRPASASANRRCLFVVAAWACAWPCAGPLATAPLALPAMRPILVVCAFSLAACSAKSEGQPRGAAERASAAAAQSSGAASAANSAGLAPTSDAGLCGDPVLMARFDACRRAADQQNQGACERAGGRWGKIGLHQGCQCPTGQDRCVCTRQGDCLGRCVADGTGRGCEQTPDRGYHCSGGHDVVGCICYRDPDGKVASICTD
jgi:hypothetical protein